MHRPLARRLGTPISLALLGATLAGVSGCTAIAYAAVAAEEARRQSYATVEADYHGLDGKSYAVLVTADRGLQAEFPMIVPRFTTGINERLKEESLASGYVPSADLLRYTYNHPAWVAQPLGEVAAELGVDRLVLVEIQEYRLYEPGNRYIWDGTVFATVGVVEADSLIPDEFVYTNTVRIIYPEKDKNFTSEDTNLNEGIIAQILETRFIDRVSWLFYEHKEKGSIEY